MNKRSSDLEPISGSVRFSTNKVRTQHWRRVGNFTQAKVPQNLFLTPWVKGKWQLSVPSNNSTSGQATGRPTLLVWTSSLQRTQLMQTRKWRHSWLSSGAQPTNCSKISSLRTSHRTRITISSVKHSRIISRQNPSSSPNAIGFTNVTSEAAKPRRNTLPNYAVSLENATSEAIWQMRYETGSWVASRTTLSVSRCSQRTASPSQKRRRWRQRWKPRPGMRQNWHHQTVRTSIAW